MPTDETPGEGTLKSTPLDHMREARGWERALPIFIQRDADGWQIRIYWRRLLLSLSALVIGGWLFFAAAAWTFVRFHRGVTEVSFLHLALPWRWDEYRVIRGDHYIRDAREMLATARWRAAYVNLYVGLQKNPANRDGRLLLAEFYLRLRRYRDAEKTLLDGMPLHREDIAYLREVFRFLLQLQDDDKVLSLASTMLTEPGSEDRKNIAAFFAATARFHRGNYDRAEDLLAERRLIGTREGRLLISRIDWERGQPELSLFMLRQLAAAFPKDDEITAELAGRLRATAQLDDARRLNILRQLNNPRSPRPRIDLIQLYQDSGDVTRAHAEIEDFIRDFDRDSDAMASLADFAARTGDIALARRVYEHCRAGNLPWDTPAVDAVEAAIIAKDYQGALELARELLRANPEWSRRYYVAFNGLQAVAHFGLGDREAASLYLRNFLGQAGARSDQLVAHSRLLLAVGATDDARDVLARAFESDPLNQAALSRLIELDLASGRIDALPANTRALLTMRKPSPTLLRAVQHEIGRDRWLFLPGRTALLDTLQTVGTGLPRD